MAGVDVGTAYLNVVPSLEDFGKKLKSGLGNSGFSDAGKRAGDSASKGFGGAFTSGLKSIIGPAAAILGGLGAVNFLKDSIGEARESQKVGALTAQVIKSTGGAAKVTADQIGDLSTAISNKTGIDDEQIQSSANMLLTFTNVRNEVGKGNDIFDQATQTITDMSAALGQDGKSSAVKLGKALNDPIKGVTALSRVGVTFTQQQKDQIKTLVDSGKTLEAQKIILAELNKKFGGAAAAQATAGEKMAVAFGNLKEQLGTALLPLLDKFATIATEKLIPGLSGVVDILTKGDFTAAFGEAFDIQEDSPFVRFLFKVREGLLKVPALLKQAGLGVRALFAAFNGEGVTSDGLVGFMEEIGVVARQVFEYLKGAIPPIWEAFKQLGPPVKEVFKQLFAANAQNGLSTLSLFKDVLAALPGILTALVPMVANLAKWMGENQEFVAGLVVALTAGITAFKVITTLVKAFTVVQGILNVVLSANPIGLIVIAIAALVAGLIYAYNNSETFRDIVQGVFRAVGEAARFMWNVVIAPVLKFFGQALAGIIDFLGQLLSALGNIPGFEWAREAGEKVQNAAKEVSKFTANIKEIPESVPVDIQVTAHFDKAAAAALTLGSGRKLDLQLDGARALGGPVRAGGAYLVGERGPEIFQPDTAGTVIPNGAAPVGGASVEQIFNGDIVAKDYSDFQRKMQEQRQRAPIGRRGGYG